MFDTTEIWRYFGGGDTAGVSWFAIAVGLFVLTFVSEDAACVAAGTLASNGRIGLAVAILACFAGIVVGDAALYGAGRLFGIRLIENRFFKRFVSPDSISRVSKWMERRGAVVVFVSRFVTGLRLPTYFAAGMFKANFGRFLAYFLLAAFIWTPIAVGAAFTASEAAGESIFLGVILAAACIFFFARLVSREGRRRFIGKVRGIINWEFWPVQIFYAPVFLYVLWLSFKHRSLTVFTLANPGIMAGGLVGESKSSIYEMIASSPMADDRLLRYKRIDARITEEEKLEEIATFMGGNKLSFPIVLKPDVGERGKGVTIVKDRSDALRFVQQNKGDIIVQEFFDGVEASVFYFRHPSRGSGQVFSITEKRFPEVIGDGISDLRTLILNDPRAVVLADKYFEHKRDKLEMVPENGEAVRLVEIGTHSRGAIFVDGEWLRSEKLEREIDELCRTVDGFFFGRFDLRAANFDDLRDGGPFKIIELNGVSSESTNIYDPKFSLADAYGILFAQWRTAFEIGAANRKMGFEPMPLMTVIKLVLGFRIESFGLETAAVS